MRTPNEKQLQTLLEIFKDFDPERLTQDVARLGEHWADQDAAASGFEESRKSVLAKLVLEYACGARLDASGKAKAVPMNLAEQQALADDRYCAHVDMMVDARKLSNINRVRYDMGKMKLELIRSLQATLRQEMHMTGSRITT